MTNNPHSVADEYYSTNELTKARLNKLVDEHTKSYLRALLTDERMVEVVAEVILHHDDNYAGAWFEQRDAVKNDFRHTASKALQAIMKEAGL